MSRDESRDALRARQQQWEDEIRGPFAEIDRIVAMGGALAAIETGYFQRALGREQYERHRDIESGARKWVGVNHLVLPEEKRQLEIWKLDESLEAQQCAKLRALRAGRDPAAVERGLEGVRVAARNGSNLVPACLDAVKAYATHGEICNAMRDVFGVYRADSQTAGV